MTIVFDNKSEKVDDFIMVDDGTGSDISTPLIMISQTDGERLRDEMVNRDQVFFQIRVEFKIPEKGSMVEYSVYFSSHDQQIYSFLE